MSWHPVEGTGWEVNRDGLYSVIRGVEAYRAIDKYSEVTKDDRNELMRSFFPKIQELTVNWSAVNPEVDLRSRQFFDLVLRDLVNQPENAFRNLAIVVDEGRTLKDKFYQKNSAVTLANLEAVRAANKSLDWGETGLLAVRDGSIILFVALATSGAGAVALGAGGQLSALGVGSSIRGYATWTETGNVGAALLSGSTTFTASAIGIAGAAMGAVNLAVREKVVLVAVEAGFAGMRTGVQALADGKSVQPAVIEAIAAAGFSVAFSNYGGVNLSTKSVPIQVVISLAADRTTAIAGKWDTSAPQVLGSRTAAGIPARKSDTNDFMKRHVLRQKP